MDKYLNKIANAQTLDELDEIVEIAACDDSLLNNEYCDIYAEALKKAQNF
jgi:hypothetical protein